MTPTLTIQELALVIAAKNLTPALLTPDFLKASGIIPSDWELARQPIFTPQIAQVAFTNINIIAQPGSISFIESQGANVKETLQIPSIARKYIEALPNLDYQAVGINPRSFVTFDDEAENEDAARAFIFSTLLSPGSWQEVGLEAVRAGVNLVYTLERGKLNLTVNEAKLQLVDQPAKPAVLFSGNFPYEIVGDASNERRQHLFQLIENWLTDWETYREIVNERFLALQSAKAHQADS